jgi:transposase
MAMDTRMALMADEKEKLVDEILVLRERVRTLEDELKKLQEKAAPSVAASPPPELEKKRGLPPHRWGRKEGHPGCARPKPAHIDRTVELTLSHCPNCRHTLGSPAGSEDHIQEDIVPARVEVTRFVHHRYWCPGCRGLVTTPYASDEVPHGYLGPRALATMVWLKYHAVLPGNKIQAVLEDLCGLRVSEGAITQALQRLGRYLKIETAVILDAIRAAAVKHADETGWRINGIGHWFWSFLAARWALIHVDPSRGGHVPTTVLGKNFQGVLVSDFYRFYDTLTGRKQKCLVHLKRDIREARSPDPPEDFRAPDKILTRLLADAERLARQREKLSIPVFARRMRRLKDRLFLFASGTYSHPFWQRISARLLKHENALLTFVEITGVPPDNNAAERSIKPHVILRNRSFQNRTPAGAEAHGVLSSVLQTLLRQNRPVVPEIARAYLHHRQGASHPVMFTPAG